MKIGDVSIGLDAQPFIIAELSGNHNGSLDRALAIVDAVAASGAQALKLQTYTADTMTLDLSRDEFFIADPDSPWQGKSLYALYQEAHTPWEWHEPIFRRARSQGLLAFSSPFDATAVDFLEELDVPAFKVASFENTDIPLIQRVSSTGKPVIISTGLASEEEVDEAVQAARAAGCRDLILLKCTSNYPASPAASNLKTLPYLRSKFGCEVGVSDHTLGTAAAVGSIGLGATIIEKHVTLSRADGGVDSGFSLEPHELRQLVGDTRIAWQAAGQVRLGPTAEERKSLVFRRSLYVCEDLNPGDELTQKNLRAIRPGLGLSPKYMAQVLGARVTRAVVRGTPLSWELIGRRPPGPAGPA
jgi:N-acetylneuraminate synthase